MQGVKIGYLGPVGTYSHQGATGLAFSQKELVACASIEDVVALVGDGSLDYGLVPVENSLGGSVEGTLDALGWYKANIVAELTLNIRHKLLSKTPLTLAEVREVYSHPQPLTQCRGFLRTHLPGVKTVAVASTASAIEDLDSQLGQAVIGGDNLQQAYQLFEIVDNLVGEGSCQTRFWLVGRPERELQWGKPTKTCLRLDVKDEVGALARVLHVFADSAINLSSIQSRPSGKKLGHYYFYIEIDISQEDPRFATCKQGLAPHIDSLEIYGSYCCL